MTDPQLQKHKAHCDMWDCETCKTPSSTEREKLLEAIGDIKYRHASDPSYLAVMRHNLPLDEAHAIVDFILSRDQSTRTQVLEEVEAEGPKDFTVTDCNIRFDLKKGTHCFTHDSLADDGVCGEGQAMTSSELLANAINKEWRALLQRKKGSAPQTTVMEKEDI